MINKLIFYNNLNDLEPEITSFIKKNIKELYISNLKEVEILFKNKNIIYSSQNKVGKTLILYSLLYVLGEARSSANDLLIGFINKKTKTLFKDPIINKEIERDNFLFTFYPAIEFTYENDIFTLERSINLVLKNNELNFEVDNKWIVRKDGKNLFSEVITRKDLINTWLPIIFDSWPKIYGFSEIKGIYEEKLEIDKLKISKFENDFFTPNDYGYFFVKKQNRGGNKNSSLDLFDFDKYWSKEKTNSLIYSLFYEQEKNVNENNYDTKFNYSKEINNLKKEHANLIIERKFIDKINKNQRKIVKDEVTNFQNLMKEMNKFNINIFDKMVSSNDDIKLENLLEKKDEKYPNLKNIVDTKIKEEQYNALLDKALKIIIKNEQNNSNKIDRVLIREILKEEIESDKLNLDNRIIDIEEIFIQKKEETKKEYEKIKLFSEDKNSEISKNLNHETGASYILSQLSTLRKLVENNDKKYPYFIIDDIENSITTNNDKSLNMKKNTKNDKDLISNILIKNVDKIMQKVEQSFLTISENSEGGLFNKIKKNFGEDINVIEIHNKFLKNENSENVNINIKFLD